jgi:hypothetical protein
VPRSFLSTLKAEFIASAQTGLAAAGLDGIVVLGAGRRRR